MKVFISWSQSRSKAVAEALREWLPTIIQSIQPWMSDQDIDKGTRGMAVLAKQLEDSNFGIICLTPENLTAPWLLFEAGALSKSQDEARLWTVLYEVEYTAIKGPLSQFQHIKTNKEDVWQLLGSVNTAQGAVMLTEPQLRTAFERGWLELEEKLSAIPAQTQKPPERDQKDMVVEVLEIVRELSRRRQSKISEELVRRQRVAWLLREGIHVDVLRDQPSRSGMFHLGEEVFSKTLGFGTINGFTDGTFTVFFRGGGKKVYAFGDSDVIKIEPDAEEYPEPSDEE